MTFKTSLFIAAIAGLALSACTTTPKPAPEVITTDKPETRIMTQVAQTCDAEALEVYFQRGETGISDIASAAIKAFGNRYSNCSYKMIEIEGHTDSVGDAETNLAFSQERARIVQKELEAVGIDAARIRIIPLGERKAIEADGDIAPMNRKTIVRVIN